MFSLSDGPHVVYINANLHVNQLFWNGSNWGNQDLTVGAGGNTTTLASGLSTFSLSDGPHIAYVDSNQRVNQTWYTTATNTWNNQDLTGTVGSPVLAAPDTELTTVLLSDGPRVFYVDSNQHVSQLFWNGSNWGYQDITVGSGANAATLASGLANYLQSDGPHILFIDSNQHVNQIWYTIATNTWNSQDLTGVLNGNSASTYTSLATFAISDGPHAVYIDINQHVNQIWYTLSTGAWHTADLTAGLGGPVASQGTGLSTYTGPDGTHVFLIDSSNHIRQYWWTGSQWLNQDLSAGVNGTLPASDSPLTNFALSDNIPHIIFIDSNGHVEQLWWAGNGFAEQDLTAATGGPTGWVARWIPTPPPPIPCSNCGLNYAESGGSGDNAQAVYAPNSSNTLYAFCTSGSTGQVIPCNISLSTTYYSYTNGHFHNNPPPPVSSINPTSGYTGNYSNWEMPVTLRTTQVGQIESIYVSDDDNGNVIHDDYGVGYLGLVYMGNSEIFYQTGGNTTNHGDNTYNHYMTANAANGLQNAADFYINNFNPDQEICVNDMALPIGGKFDIHDDWQSPHISHDQGTAAEVAAVAGQCPASYVVNLNTFRQVCINVGHSLAPNTITEGNHVHCRWAN